MKSAHYRATCPGEITISDRYTGKLYQPLELTVRMGGRTQNYLRCLRFSLRSLIVVVLLSAVGFARFYYEFKRAERRRIAVERLCGFPGIVQYEDHRRPPNGTHQSSTATDDVNVVRVWLTEHLGVDFFHDVQTVCLDGREQFSDADLAAACRLHKLTSLRLGRTSISDDGMQPISKLAELQRLGPSSPHLTDRAMSHIAKLGKLEQLGLYDVAVTDAGLAKLAVLGALKDVSLRKTQVTAEGVAALQSKLPHCKITLKP